MRRLSLLLVLSLGVPPAVGEEAPPVLPPTATLRVVPSGGWARVRIDGKDRGLGPVSVALPAGPHVVTLPESAHHRATERTVLLAPGETVEVRMARPLKDSWVEMQGWPPGTWLEVDGGPGPVVADGVRLTIRDGALHGLVFRHDDQVLREVAVQRCVDAGCLLPGAVRVERWAP